MKTRYHPGAWSQEYVRNQISRAGPWLSTEQCWSPEVWLELGPVCILPLLAANGKMVPGQGNWQCPRRPLLCSTVCERGGFLFVYLLPKSLPGSDALLFCDTEPQIRTTFSFTGQNGSQTLQYDSAFLKGYWSNNLGDKIDALKFSISTLLLNAFWSTDSFS